MSQKNFHGAYVNGFGQIDLWTDIEPRDMIEVAYCRFIYIYIDRGCNFTDSGQHGGAHDLLLERVWILS